MKKYIVPSVVTIVSVKEIIYKKPIDLMIR